MEKLEKVLLGISTCTGDLCKGCPYEEEEACVEELHRETQEVLKAIKEKDGAALQAGVPPMPCSVGDELWGVYKDPRQDVHIAKVICTELLWNGEEWLIGSDDCCYENLGENCFLKLDEAVKKAEEILKHG